MEGDILTKKDITGSHTEQSLFNMSCKICDFVCQQCEISFRQAMDLTDVTILSNGPVLGLIRWLQGQNLLANPLRCVPCNRAMDLNERNGDHVDGFLWSVYTKYFNLPSAGVNGEGVGRQKKNERRRRNFISRLSPPTYLSRSPSTLSTLPPPWSQRFLLILLLFEMREPRSGEHGSRLHIEFKSNLHLVVHFVLAALRLSHRYLISTEKKIKKNLWDQDIHPHSFYSG